MWETPPFFDYFVAVRDVKREAPPTSAFFFPREGGKSCKNYRHIFGSA